MRNSPPVESAIEPLSPPFHRVVLSGGELAQVEFELRLTQTGQYAIPVALMLGFDGVDYELIEDGLHIDLGEDWREVMTCLAP